HTAFKQKWEYLFEYLGVSFAKHYIPCHMLTFIHQVSRTFLPILLLFDRPFLLTEQCASVLKLILQFANPENVMIQMELLLYCHYNYVAASMAKHGLIFHGKGLMHLYIFN
ncbi:hypothetical protein K443DRAFT_113759, partial [Laccaria amethystina LaAM-08-1]